MYTLKSVIFVYLYVFINIFSGIISRIYDRILIFFYFTINLLSVFPISSI